MTQAITLNAAQQLYVIPCGGGYSCWGFAKAFEEVKALAKRLRREDLVPSDQEFGSLSIIDKHRQLITLAGDRDLGTWFSPRAPRRVREILENARLEGTRLRIFYGDRDTGRDWLSEHDMLGHIGRSCGTLKIPLLVTPGEWGGPGILDDAIVRIIDADAGVELYRHRRYHRPPLRVVYDDESELPVSVMVDGETQAAFATTDQAATYIAFLTGRCMQVPA